jgi:hypothetical protein
MEKGHEPLPWIKACTILTLSACQVQNALDQTSTACSSASRLQTDAWLLLHAWHPAHHAGRRTVHTQTNGVHARHCSTAAIVHHTVNHTLRAGATWERCMPTCRSACDAHMVLHAGMHITLCKIRCSRTASIESDTYIGCHAYEAFLPRRITDNLLHY